MKQKLIRITTIPISLMGLLRGQSRFMTQYYDVIGVSSPGKELQMVELNEGVATIPVKMTRTISPVKDIKALWNLYKIFIEERPLIVHTHTPKAGTVGMIAAKLAGVPIRLHTVAGLPLLESKGLKRKLLIFVESVTYFCATRVYPNSFNLRDIILRERLSSNSKMKVIANGSSNGIDSKWFCPERVSYTDVTNLRESLKIRKDDFIFIFVGRIVRDKGLNELVAAFNVVNKLYPQTKLLLVGQQEVELDPLLDETIEYMKKNKNIISVGFQSDVRPYFAISQVLTFPSYREGFPNVVMQAGAMGLPSIVSDINGNNEIILEGVNGIIIPAKNSTALRVAMLNILEDHELRVRLQTNARRMIVDRYEQDFVWNSILEEYRNCEVQLSVNFK